MLRFIRRLSIVAAPIALLIIGLTATTASAATPSYAAALDQAVAHQLQAYPGGTQVSSNEVAYDGGKVMVVFPDASGFVPTASGARTEVTPNATYEWHGCPYGNVASWYCFYQNANFGGRMLEFQDCSGSGLDQSFSTYGFSNETTSWVNTSGIEALSTNKYVGVWQGGNYLWGEDPDSDSANVGKANNDKAQWFETYC
jgi:hypothetical protein